jgi:hypothetical protein
MTNDTVKRKRGSVPLSGIIYFFEIHPLFFLDQYRIGDAGLCGEGNIYNLASHQVIIHARRKKLDQPGNNFISILNGDQYQNHPHHPQ